MKPSKLISRRQNFIANTQSKSGHSLLKASLLFIAVFAFAFAACNGGGDDGKKTAEKKEHHGHGHPKLNDGTYEFIPADSANKMIQSYLNSINIANNDSDLHSLTFNADTLRAYLADSSIKSVKIMLAHTLDYINNGGQDQPCGYQCYALTVVVAGYDSLGNYVYYHYPQSAVNMVIDHSQPCPTDCPKKGSASSDILQYNKRK